MLCEPPSGPPPPMVAGVKGAGHTCCGKLPEGRSSEGTQHETLWATLATWGRCLCLASSVMKMLSFILPEMQRRQTKQLEGVATPCNAGPCPPAWDRGFLTY